MIMRGGGRVIRRTFIFMYGDVAKILTLVAMGLLIGIGVPLGVIGLQLLTSPAMPIVINSYTLALMFLSFAFFAGIIVYTKVRLSVGMMSVSRTCEK